MSKVLDALNMADRLMADGSDFQRGYSRENAELAVIDYYALEGNDRAAFLRIMEQKEQ